MVKAEVAFALLVRERPQAPLGPPITPTASDLGFTPAGHDRWVSNDHRLVLDTWHGRGGGGAHRYPGGVAVLAGYGWRRGSSWGDPRGWSAAASGAHGAGAGHGVLLGQYAAAQLSDGGSGWASADPFGMRCMYTGERADALVLASRAALAARLLAHPGAVPPRHAATAGWLGLTSYNAGLDTGFEGVAVVPVGARLVLDRGSAHWATDHPFHLPEDDPLRSCDLEELADLVLDEVATGLLAALDVPAERHVVRLTGGKDSRMVVAAAHRAGIAQEFHYETVGPPGFPDVVLAARIAELHGLRHDVRFLGTRPREPFADRFRAFVEGTAGVVNGWELEAPPTSEGDVVLTGVCGELLRALRRVPDHCQSDEGVAQFVLTPDPGRLGLVPEHVRVELAGSLKERVAPAPDRPDHPVDRVHALYAQNRMRFNRVGPRRELSGTISVHPLHTPSAVRAAMAVDPLLRQDDVLTALMLQRSDPDLLTIPVTGGWSERARAHVPELRNDLVVATAPRTPGGGRERLGGRPADAGRAGPDTTPATGPTDPAPTPGADSKLMAKVNAVAPDRRELLSELFADRHNRTWDVLDRMAALEALARYEVLDNTERRELFGAATAVAWLDGH